MSTYSTCQPLRLNRSPDYPMTRNARSALNPLVAPTTYPLHRPFLPHRCPHARVSLLCSSRQLATGMQYREAIVAL